MRRRSDAGQVKPPLVVVEKLGGATRIVALDRSARRAGLAVGLSLADARARIPEIRVEEADSAADRALLEAIAEDCDRFSPVVMLDAPDGLLLDIAGCDHLYGGETGLRRHVSQRLRRAGLHVRTVIASAPDTARALVRYGAAGIVAPGKESDAVRSLPVVALELPEADRVAMQRAGLKSVGSLIDRPSQLFSARFGERATLRVRRLQGLDPSPLDPLRRVPDIWIDRRFPEPIGRAEDIEAVLSELASAVCDELSARREGGRAFEAAFHRADGVIRRIIVETGRPLRDAMALRRLFREKLDSIADPVDPGFGFDVIRLSLLRVELLASLQSSLDARSVDEEAIAHLADRLAARFGAKRVLRFVAQNTHDPVRAARAVPYDAANGASVWPLPLRDEPPLRPLHMFDPPQPIKADMLEVPDGAPRRFDWRRRRHSIVHAEGPERIEPAWWCDPKARVRDYYRVEDTEGRRFWLYREGEYGAAHHWYVHGVFA